jgi:hypothetical protein
LSLTSLMFLASSAALIFRESWRALHNQDPRKILACEMAEGSTSALRSVFKLVRRAQ